MTAKDELDGLLARCDAQLLKPREAVLDQAAKRNQHDDLILIAELRVFLDENHEHSEEDSATSGGHGGTPDEEEGREGLDEEEEEQRIDEEDDD